MGPRVILFLSEKDFIKKKQLSELFSKKLLYTFKGFSTHFGAPDEKGVKVSEKIKKGKIHHRIEIFTIESFFKKHLNYDIKKQISVFDWLVFPEQKLLTITDGTLFYDMLGLEKNIKKFKYYPKDVWYYLLASQWVRISQEQHFMGRCGELNDEIGSKIIATRLVKDIMKMCFLMEKQYTPYIKWFGTGFNKLKSSKKLKPILNSIIKSNNWKTREIYLAQAYELLAKLHNSLKITKPQNTKIKYFHNRPFLVIDGDLFVSEITKQIKDLTVKSIKLKIGSLNQFSDSTDVFEANTQRFKSIYR